MTNGKRKKKSFLFQDFLILVASLVVAYFLLESGIVFDILGSTGRLGLLGSFLAGMFFTSLFTTAPAIVVLGEIAQSNSLITTALVGGFGAVVGDVILFRFVRDRFSKHLGEMIKNQGFGKKVQNFLKLKYVRWSSFLLGGMIIASPLPDELGISLLGLSKMPFSTFITISFVFNSFGILLIGLVARVI